MAATGIELLFNACVARFNARLPLKAVGRKLSMVPQSSRPWTEFEAIGGNSDLDGFTDDIETHTVRFTYHGKQPLIRGASNWLELMTGAFDDFSGLAVTGYTTSGVNRLPADPGPEMVDGRFEARAEYEFILHRDTLLPAVRGA